MRSTAIEYPYCTPAAELEALIRDGFVPNDPTYTQTLHPEFELGGGGQQVGTVRRERFQAKREKLEIFNGLLPETTCQNMALIALYVPWAGRGVPLLHPRRRSRGPHPRRLRPQRSHVYPQTIRKLTRWARGGGAMTLVGYGFVPNDPTYTRTRSRGGTRTFAKRGAPQSRHTASNYYKRIGIQIHNYYERIGVQIQN